MSDTVNAKGYVQDVHLDERPPPLSTSGPIAWLRINLFDTWYNALLTLLVGYVVIDLGIGIFDWAIWSATFSEISPDECRASVSGACWSFVHNWWRFILFGLYPYDEQWRPAAFLGLAIAMIGYSCWPGSWRKSLVYMWAVALVM
ncbi:MAG: amino acid ABC transporter permease, partial [Pseudomonadota bacterium]